MRECESLAYYGSGVFTAQVASEISFISSAAQIRNQRLQTILGLLPLL